MCESALNLLEPSGPVQACTEIALTLLLEDQLFVVFMQRPAVQSAGTVYAWMWTWQIFASKLLVQQHALPSLSAVLCCAVLHSWLPLSWQPPWPYTSHSVHLFRMAAHRYPTLKIGSDIIAIGSWKIEFGFTFSIKIIEKIHLFLYLSTLTMIVWCFHFYLKFMMTRYGTLCGCC
jgi:hypothetical protein